MARRPAAKPVFARLASATPRAALIASVSLLSLAASGVLGLRMAAAQEAAQTLPGTQILPGGRWTGARLPTVAQTNTGLVMTIKQEAKTALLDWSRFDVAGNEEVIFDQGGADWIALNRIFNQNPTQIAGKITAKGQVWLANTNGVVFKSGAQVNTHSILVTTAVLPDSLLSTRGLLDFTETYPGLLGAKGDIIVEQGAKITLRSTDPTVTSKAIFLGVNVINKGEIDVADGQVMMMAGEDFAFLPGNSGEYLSFTYMRSFFGLLRAKSPGYFRYNNEARFDQYMFDRAALLGGMRVVNDGTIRSTRGNVFMQGAEIQQNGIVLSTSGVRQRSGSIILRAGFGYDDQELQYSGFFDHNAGKIVLGQGSLTQITPDASDDASPALETFTGDNRSRITLAAADITMDKGSTLRAKSGLITIDANPTATPAGDFQGIDSGKPGTFTMKDGALIDVSGVRDVALSVTDNIVDVEARSNELAGSPKQRDGILYAQDVKIDIRRGASIVDWTGALANRNQTAEQRSVNGGEVQIRALRSVRIDNGARIDISGGSANYAGGMIDYTLLTAADGRVFDIAEADANLKYTGLSKGSRYEAGYSEGGDAGKLEILSSSQVLFGRVVSDVFNGERQIAGGLKGLKPVTPAGSNEAVPITRLAKGGEVALGTASESLNEYYYDQVFITPGQGPVTLAVEGGTVVLDPTKLDSSGYLTEGGYTQVLLGTGANDPKFRLAPGWVVVDGRPAELRGALVARGYSGAALEALMQPGATLPTGFVRGDKRRYTFIEDDFASGVQTLTFNDKTDAWSHYWNIQPGVTLRVKPGGMLGVMGTPADIGNNVTLSAQSGVINLMAARIGSGTVLSVAGGWVNDVDNKGQFGGYVDAGSLSLFGAILEGDVTLDASGGGWWKRTSPDTASGPGNFELVSGKGGSVSISRNPLQGAAELLDRADFKLGGLAGFGSLSLLEMGDLVIGPDGGSAPAGVLYLTNSQINSWGVGALSLSGGVFPLPLGQAVVGRMSSGTIANPNQPNAQSPDAYLIRQGEVITAEKLALIIAANTTAAAYNTTRPAGTPARNIISLVSVAATVDVVDGARIDLKRQTWTLNGPASAIASGADLSRVTTAIVLPDHLRSGAALSLGSAGFLRVSDDAVIKVDPLGAISLSGTYVDIAGDLVARGGTISLASANGATAPGIQPSRLNIRSTALLDASGLALTRRVQGASPGDSWIEGRVLAGGKIDINAKDELIVEQGALFDVSGASAVLTVTMPSRFSAVRTDRLLGSDAGEIVILAGEGYMLGDIRGDAGTPDARAGIISLSGGKPGQLFIPGSTVANYGLQSIITALSTRLLAVSTSATSLSLNATGGTATKNISTNNLRDWWGAPAQAALRTATGLQASDIEPIPFTRTGDTVVVTGTGGGTFRRATAADIANILSLFEKSFAPMTSGDQSGRFYLDPNLTALPTGVTTDGALPAGALAPTFAVPTGYTPTVSAASFLNAMTALRQTNATTTAPTATILNSLTTPTDFTVGKGVFDKLSTFDTVTLGSISLKGDLTIAAKGKLNLSGAVNSTGASLTVRAPQIVFGGILNLQSGSSATTPALPLTSGVFNAYARDIYVNGAAFNGFGTVNLEARHTLAGGNIAVANSRIYAAGDLNITAGQIYPYTGMQFSLVSDKSITIKGTGEGGAAPLSAAGVLKIQAPVINQGGVVAAPFGLIEFNGTEVNFLPGSLTTVSAGDRTILYGYTVDGSTWYGPTPASLTVAQLLSTPPEKRITITGDNVDLRAGAVIDASGGGDVLGLEFVQGPQGSINILTGPGVFAISPAFGADVSLGQAPSEAPRADLAIGDVVWLPAFDGNAAGYYTLLPAQYALTPGGYRISVAQAGVAGSTVARASADGSFILAGYQAGEQGQAYKDQSYTTFSLLSGGEVRQRSEFIETRGNTFFSSERFLTGLERAGGAFNANPRLPIDGGFMTIAARKTLQLNGTFSAGGSTANSRGGVLDIAGDYIVIASAGTDISDLGAGYLRLDPKQLSGVAESLLIGGVRRQGAGGLEIVTGYEGRAVGGAPIGSTVGAERIVVRNGDGDALTGPEILFTATGEIVFEEGSVVRAVGDGYQAPDVLIRAELPGATVNSIVYAPEDRGAFVRVSNLGDVTITRTAPRTDRGDIIVEAGVRLEATDAVALNATRNTTLAPGAILKAGVIEAAAGRVSFGDAPGSANGLVLTQAAFNALAGAQTLRLRSLTNFELYGDVTLSTSNNLVLDGGGIVDMDGTGASSFSAKSLVLTNTLATVHAPVANTATLSLSGETVTRGGGSMGLSFGQISIDAKGRMLFSGVGATDSLGALSIRATEIAGAGGAAHDVTVAGSLDLLSQAQAMTLTKLETAGASLDFIGDTVTIDLPVALASGVLRATASGGDLTVGSKGRIDASGSAIAFFEKTEYLAAGAIGLSSENGDVIVSNGAVLDVSGGTGGGDAGSILLSASRGVAQLNGTLRGGAGAGFRGGQFTLSTSTLADFGGLNAKLNDSGFSRLRRFSIVDGDVTINGVTRVETFELSTGSGSVTVAGGSQIITTGEKGGKILIASGGDLTVNDGALFDAGANGANQRGGDISLQVGDNGAMMIGAATLDVSATGTGQAGEVRLRARQVGNDVAVVGYGATVVGGVTQLEAYRVTDLGAGDGVIDTALQNQVTSQAAAYMAAATTGIRTRLGQMDAAKFVISPGIEIRAGGDLTLVNTWNLKDARYNGVAGVLTLRAGGDLNIKDANLSDGFVDAVRTQEFYAPAQLNVPTLPTARPTTPNKLTNDISWSYNLVAGADFSQTNVLSTVVSAAGEGDVNLDGMVRTGTGDIKVAASGDLNYAQPDVWTFTMSTGGNTPMTVTGPNGAVFNFTGTTGINSNYVYEVNIPGLGKAWYRPAQRILVLGDGRNIAFDGATGAPPTSFFVNNASIYTAGVDAPAVADFDTPYGFTGNLGTGRPEAYYFRPNYTYRGGDVTVNVGGSMTGVDNPQGTFDWSWWRGSIVPGGQLDTAAYADPKQPFATSSWLFGLYDQTNTSILFDAFRQSIGALGGGDVTLTAGGDAVNLSVALPTSIRVSGGRTQGATKTVRIDGGGDLEMDIGGAIDGGWFYVAKGRSDIRADGSIGTGVRDTFFAIDDAKLKVQAGGAIRIGQVYSAGMAPRPASYKPQTGWLGYTENTSAEFISLGGDITYRGVANTYQYTVLPSDTRMVAPNGSINFGEPGKAMMPVFVDQFPAGRIEVLARKDINFYAVNPGQGYQSFVIGWDRPELVGRLLNPGVINCCIPPEFFPGGVYAPGGAGYSTGGGDNIREGRSEYSAFYALEGDIVSRTPQGNSIGTQSPFHTGTFLFGHETRLKAGDDIRMGAMSFYNQDPDDVSVVQARGSIYLPNISGYGEGRLWVEAGDEIFMGNTPGAGIRSVEIIDSDPTTDIENGMDIHVLTGIDQTPEYDAFLDFYLGTDDLTSKPVYLSEYYVFDSRNLGTPHATVLADGVTETTIYAVDLVNYWNEMNGRPPLVMEGADGRPLSRGALVAKITKADFDAAKAWFQGLDPVKKAPLASRIMFAELKVGGREAVGSSAQTDPSLTRNGDPTRGYAAIGKLFPGAQRKPGEAKAAGEARWFGDLIMTNSQIRTDGGGDVEILTPGGMVQLATLGITNTSPSNSGVLTQDGGSVYALTYDDYVVNQSRTMTADGGDIMIWSSFGDIDAGKGRKTSLSIPPIIFPLDKNGITRIERSGLPNGAGIATLNQVDGTLGGDVDLYAFNGIVNAGDAGIRASRDLFVGAQEIRGLDNITVGGETNVELNTEEAELGAINLENFAQAAEDEAMASAFDMSREVEKLRTVTQTILTGTVVSFGEDPDEDRKKKKD